MTSTVMHKVRTLLSTLSEYIVCPSRQAGGTSKLPSVFCSVYGCSPKSTVILGMWVMVTGLEEDAANTAPLEGSGRIIWADSLWCNILGEASNIADCPRYSTRTYIYIYVYIYVYIWRGVRCGAIYWCNVLLVSFITVTCVLASYGIIEIVHEI